MTDQKPVGQTVGKLSAILDFLAAHGDATAADVAVALGEPRSSVHRQLASLHKLQLLDEGRARGSYRLGMKLFQLGQSVVERLDLRREAIQVMERIHDETGETVFLCVQRGREAVCIERLDGRRVTVLELRLGGSLPLHAGAAPRALLAWQPRTAWDAYIESARAAGADLDPARVRADLEQTRTRGYSVSDEDVTPGIAAIGAPVFDYTGVVCGAISVSGLRHAIVDLNTQRVADLIMAAAQDVSRRMGSRDVIGRTA
jgi:DNA-binding IclR family transcriptional regulator